MVIVTQLMLPSPTPGPSSSLWVGPAHGPFAFQPAHGPFAFWPLLFPIEINTFRNNYIRRPAYFLLPR